MKMPVAERFFSVNGEGLRSGELCQFIRFAGCNLQCTYCDTAWSQSPDCAAECIEISQLAADALSKGIINITLTGGEPLLQDRLPELIRLLVAQGNLVEVETNGSLPLDGLLTLRGTSDKRLSFTLDYKLPDSGMESDMCLTNLELLDDRDAVTFVTSSIRDLERASQVIEQYGLSDRTHVYISPVTDRLEPREIVDFMKEKQLNRVRLQLKLHPYLWDPTQR